MMSLQNQTRTYLRAQGALTVTLLAGLGAFLLLFYLPSLRERSALAGEIESRQRELEMNQTRARALPMVAREVDELRGRLERFDKKLPRQQDLGRFLMDITQLSQRSDLGKWTIQPNVPRRNEMFSELPILISFEGNFEDVAGFLHRTEAMARLTRITRLEVQCQDARSGRVRVQMGMSIFFAEE